MNPTFPVSGALCDIHAPAHAIAFLSRHIGSGPGVAGLSGMHVKLLVPARSVRMVPSAAMLTIVAFFETDAGAALMALAMSCSSVCAAIGFVSADTVITSIRETRNPTRARVLARMLLPPFLLYDRSWD